MKNLLKLALTLLLVTSFASCSDNDDNGIDVQTKVTSLGNNKYTLNLKVDSMNEGAVKSLNVIYFVDSKDNIIKDDKGNKQAVANVVLGAQKATKEVPTIRFTEKEVNIEVELLDTEIKKGYFNVRIGGSEAEPIAVEFK